MKDKFQIGNILYHVPSKSKWIIIRRDEINYKQTSFWRLKTSAYCIYNPKQKIGNGTKEASLWKVNQVTNFLLQDCDLEEKNNKIWKIVYDV